MRGTGQQTYLDLRIIQRRDGRGDCKPENLHHAAECHNVTMRFEIGDLLLQPVRTRDVILVDMRNIGAARPFVPSIGRSGRTAIFDKPVIDKARIIEARDHIAGSVSGSIIDDNELEIGERLPEYRHDTLGKKCLAVIRPA